MTIKERINALEAVEEILDIIGQRIEWYSDDTEYATTKRNAFILLQKKITALSENI